MRKSHGWKRKFKNLQDKEMFGLGTILNTLAVVAGSVVGIVARNGFKQSFQDIP